MGDSSAQYIHTVHHLIEECIIFDMSKEECMEALSKHANIKPVITSTVWEELEKENKEFFDAYTKRREERESKWRRGKESTRCNWILMPTDEANDVVGLSSLSLNNIYDALHPPCSQVLKYCNIY